MSVIKVEDIAFIRFQAPDLSAMQTFLDEFGLKCFSQHGTLYARGTDGAPFIVVVDKGAAKFVGIGFRAASRADLRALADHDGVAVEAADAPGGGSLVRLSDPDGNLVDIVADQAREPAEPLAPDTPFNSLNERRRFQIPVRIEPAPSHVRRLGHAMIMVADYDASCAWYKQRLGLIASDEVVGEGGVPFGAFLRCDRGDTPTDHHSLAVAAAPSGAGFGHVAFEVNGFDDLMKGHSYLQARNREHAWGVGRHKLGSQIFDYWKDPWGHEFEHWTDGDLHTADHPTGTGTLDDLLGSQWGPRHPSLSGAD